MQSLFLLAIQSHIYIYILTKKTKFSMLAVPNCYSQPSRWLKKEIWGQLFFLLILISPDSLKRSQWDENTFSFIEYKQGKAVESMIFIYFLCEMKTVSVISTWCWGLERNCSITTNSLVHCVCVCGSHREFYSINLFYFYSVYLILCWK